MANQMIKTVFMAALLSLSFSSYAENAAQTDGLVKVASKAVDSMYIKPATDLSAYTSLLLEDAHVSFRKDAYNRHLGNKIQAQKAIDKASHQLKTVFRDTFTNVITDKGQLNLVTTANQHTLRVIPKLTDVYLAYLKEEEQTANMKVYAKSAGEMTLELALHDAQSGELLARIVDKREATEWAHFMRQTKSGATQQSKRMIARWANTLNDGLVESTLYKPK